MLHDPHSHSDAEVCSKHGFGSRDCMIAWTTRHAAGLTAGGLCCFFSSCRALCCLTRAGQPDSCLSSCGAAWPGVIQVIQIVQEIGIAYLGSFGRGQSRSRGRPGPPMTLWGALCRKQVYLLQKHAAYGTQSTALARAALMHACTAATIVASK